MRSFLTVLAPTKCAPSIAGLFIVGFTLNAFAPAANAQPIVNSLIDPLTASPILPDTPHPNRLTSSTGDAPVSAPLQFAGVGFHPGLSYRFLDCDSLQNRAGEPRKTEIHGYTAFMRLGGTNWGANYTPTWIVYSNPEFDDTGAHVANINGARSFGDVTVSVEDHYQYSNAPQIETGAQTKEESNGASIGFEQSFGNSLSLELRGSQDYRWSEISPNSKEWATNDWVHYKMNGNTTVSAGLVIGYVAVGGSQPDNSYYRPQVGIRWQPTAKISFDAEAGYESRKFKGTGSRTVHTPTYGGSIVYAPFLTTSVRFGAERSLQVGYIASDIQKTNSWDVSLQQRLLGRLQLGAAYSNQSTDYIANSTGLATGREDRSRTLNLTLSTAISRYGNIALIYLRTANDSSAQRFAFVSNQIGIQVGFQY